MTYDELVTSIETAAEQKNYEILERAHREAEELIRDTNLQAETVRNRYMHESLKKAGVERNRQMYLTSEEMKASLSQIKKDLFSQTFTAAWEKLQDIRSSPGYHDLFEHLLTETIQKAGGGDYEVHIDRRDLSLCKTLISRLEISAVILPDIECLGGLILTTNDGKITVSNTIETRLERMKEVFRLEIYADLTGD